MPVYCTHSGMSSRPRYSASVTRLRWPCGSVAHAHVGNARVVYRCPAIASPCPLGIYDNDTHRNGDSVERAFICLTRRAQIYVGLPHSISLPGPKVRQYMKRCQRSSSPWQRALWRSVPVLRVSCLVEVSQTNVSQTNEELENER